MVLLKSSNIKPKFCPPKRFRAAVNPTKVQFCAPPSFAQGTPRGRGRRAEGIRYERRVQKYLCDLYGDCYLPGPWLSFYDVGDQRICQPDGILFDLKNGRIILIEIKLRHCEEAYWQLHKLYLPLLRQMFPYSLWDICCLEIVRWYDPAIVWPVKTLLRENILDTPSSITNKIGVHIYNKV